MIATQVDYEGAVVQVTSCVEEVGVEGQVTQVKTVP